MSIYFLTFWTAGRLAARKLSYPVIIWTIYISGLGVALAGFLTAVGAIHIKDGFVGTRVYSTLQYPNALAIYLAAVVVFGFYLWLMGNRTVRLVLTPCNFLIIMVFFSTNSRGGFLVFPVMLLVYLIGLRNDRVQWLAHAGMVCILGVVASGKFVSAAAGGSPGSAWAWLLGGAGAAVVLQWLLEIAGKYAQSLTITRRKAAATGAVVLIGCFLLLGLWSTQTQPAAVSGESLPWYYQILPEHMAQRIASISLENQSAQDRIFWTKEAFDLVKERPVLGYGGGAWEASYRQYQDYPYSSTQVHNHFLQVWAETGTVGFALYLVIWGLLLFTAVKNFRTLPEEKDRVLNLTLFTAAAGLGIHSFIDFDLALSAVAMVLWVSFGLLHGLKHHTSPAPAAAGSPTAPRKRLFFFGAAACLALVFFLLPTGLLLANDYVRRGVQAARAGDLEAAEDYFERAVVFDPFSGDFRATLGSIESTGGKHGEAAAHFREALSRSQFNWGYCLDFAQNYEKRGEWDEALSWARKAVDLAPWVLKTHEEFCRIAASAGIEALKEGNLQRARSVFEECASVPGRLEQQAAAVPAEVSDVWKDEGRFLNFTPGIILNAGIANYFLGRPAAARELLSTAAKRKDTQNRAYLWLAVLMTGEGENAGAEKMLGRIEDEQVKNNFQELVGLPVLNGS